MIIILREVLITMKQEKIDLAIAKCFGKIHLTEEELECLKDVKASDLFNDDYTPAQASMVLNWVRLNANKKMQQGFIQPIEDEDIHAEYWKDIER